MLALVYTLCMLTSFPPRFLDFIAPNLDRFTLLHEILCQRGLCPSMVTLAKSKHLLVGPAGERGGDKNSTRTVLIAHYDRAGHSPGANDNAAAVFQLIEAAGNLRKEGKKSWLIIFTDNEEAAKKDGARGQGSFALASAFKSIGLGKADFFIFDASGRGDTLIVSTALDLLLAGQGGPGTAEARIAVRKLRLRALDAGRKLSMSRILLSPTPFSDDAGFLAAGIAAQTLTLLPGPEAALLVASLRNQGRASMLISRKSRDQALESKGTTDFIPDTWQRLHGPLDNAESLSLSSFLLLSRFAQELCRGT
ncbi:M28 family peptidase [Treponema sp.]